MFGKVWRFFVVVVALSVILVSCAEPLRPSLELTPDARSLTPGETVQLTVTRRFPGGAVDDVTSRVVYSTSDKGIATVDDPARRGLLIAGKESGAVLIRAYDPTTDATAVATFTVAPPIVDSIEVSPSPAIVMQRSTSRQFIAFAHMRDGSTREVTALVQWSSSNDLAATVGNTSAENKGVVAAVAPGDTNIVATDNATGVQGRTIVFVAGDIAQLKAILVTPNPETIQVGKTKAFSALGVLSDGSTRDLTRDVAWSSSAPNIATVDADGVGHGIAAGDTTITASSLEPGSTIKGSAAAKVVP